MWVCFNDGFISVVKDKREENELVVRARRREILERLFPDREIIELWNSDYMFRTYCSKEELSKIMAESIDDIDYTNLKNSVTDPELKKLYGEFWLLHFYYQNSSYFTR